MFEPGSTVIHQGSYVTVLLAYLASIAGLWAFSTCLALLVASIHIVINAVLYVGLMRAPVDGKPLLQGSPLYAVLVLALVSVFAALLLLNDLSGAKWGLFDVRRAGMLIRRKVGLTDTDRKGAELG
jgi:hypothetical protein